jgi:hypothetical protein
MDFETDMELFIIMKEENTVAIGRKIKCTERGLFIMQMVVSLIKENGKMIL